MNSHHAKFQLDSSKRSQVIPLQKSVTTTTTTTPTRVELYLYFPSRTKIEIWLVGPGRAGSAWVKLNPEFGFTGNSHYEKYQFDSGHFQQDGGEAN